MTQDETILQWLLLGLPITSVQAFQLGITRLAAIVERLEKQKGWKGYITHENIIIKDRNGRNKHITKYFL